MSFEYDEGDIAWVTSGDIYILDIAARKLHHNAWQTTVIGYHDQFSYDIDIGDALPSEETSSICWGTT